MGSKLNNTEFIKKILIIYNNKYDISTINYINSKTKIKIICPIHGEFYRFPSNFLQGIGCQKCNDHHIKYKNNYKEIFIKNAIKVHQNEYSYDKIDYKNLRKKVEIICKKHGPFFQEPRKHLYDKCGCPICGVENQKRKLSDFIILSNKIHNNLYDYSKSVYKNNITPVKIKCKIHGFFNQLPKLHLNKCGCPKCGLITIGNKKRGDTEKFIIGSTKIHKNKFDYSKTIYVKNNEDVEIICKKHGSFCQTPDNHLSGKGCPKCGREKIANLCRGNTNNFIKKSIKKYGKLYHYFNVNYINAHTKIEIICKKHGSFFQKPNAHLGGNGCPKCMYIISKPEIKFLNYINIPDTLENRQVYIKPYKVDGYDSKTNTIYEFLGDYWHGNPNVHNLNDFNKVCKKTFSELYKNTKNRFNKLKSLGYTIKYIWENDWNKFKDGIDKIPKILTY